MFAAVMTPVAVSEPLNVPDAAERLPEKVAAPETIENCGASRVDRIIAAAIAARMRDSGMRVSPDDDDVAAASTSSVVMRDPDFGVTAARSTLSCAASFRAAGDVAKEEDAEESRG